MRPVARFLFALLALGLWAAPPAAAEGEPVGRAADARGDVTVHRDAGAAPLTQGAPVFVGDRIVTGPDGRVALAMNDGAEIAVGSGTELVVADYVIDSSGDRDHAVWELLRGILRAALPGSAPAPFDVETGVAVASARSTEFAVESGDGTAAVLTLEGRVEVSLTDGSAGAMLAPGFGVDVTRGEPITGPRQWPPQRVQSFIERTTVR